MKYFVLALIIGLVVFKVFFSDKPTVISPQITPPQDTLSAPQVPTSGGEGSDNLASEPVTIESASDEANIDPQQEDPEVTNPGNRIMIDQGSPASSGASSGIASSTTEGIVGDTASPLKTGEGVKLDPSSLVLDQGSHAKIFGNQNGGGSPEAKGISPGIASEVSLDQGSPVLGDKSSLTRDVPVQ